MVFDSGRRFLPTFWSIAFFWQLRKYSRNAKLKIGVPTMSMNSQMQCAR